jgi:hypothetical protein
MSEEVKIEGAKDFISEIEKEMEMYSNGKNKPITIVLPNDVEIRFGGIRVVDWEKEIRVRLIDAETTRYIYCDNQTKENGYHYRCHKLSSDDWDELSDPCDGCCHRINETVTEKIT